MGTLLLGTDWYGEHYREYREDNEPPMYTISAREYAHHLRNELILQKLMEHSVHQWDGFEAAMQDVMNDKGDEE